MASEVALCEHGIIVGSINPCGDCVKRGDICVMRNGQAMKIGDWYWQAWSGAFSLL